MKSIKAKDFLLIPNIISLFRFVLFVPIIILFIDYNSNRFFLLALAFLSIILDNLDGYFARKLNQISELGKIIDPLADKVLIGIYITGLFLNNQIVWWILAVILGRDIFIVIGSAFFSKKIDFVIPSNKLGKYTAGAIAFYIMIFLINIPIDGKILLILNLSLIFLILINIQNYISRVLKILKNKS